MYMCSCICISAEKILMSWHSIKISLRDELPVTDKVELVIQGNFTGNEPTNPSLLPTGWDATKSISTLNVGILHVIEEQNNLTNRCDCSTYSWNWCSNRWSWCTSRYSGGVVTNGTDTL